MSAGTSALQGIKGEIETFNETLCERGQHHPLTDSQCKSKAMEQLHDLNLDDDRLITIMQLFKGDADVADMFLAMKCKTRVHVNCGSSLNLKARF